MTQQQVKRRPRKRTDSEAVTEAPARPDHAKRASRDARATVSKINRALAGE